MVEESILENIGDAIYALSSDWTVTFFNRQAERYFGRDRAEVVGRNLWEMFPTVLGTQVERDLRASMESRRPLEASVQSRSTGRWAEARTFPAEDGGLVVSWRDVTEQKRQAIALNEAVENQDFLFRELTHRVTNNFQDVAARLRLQGREVTDPAARDLLAKMAVSIKCMALVHRRLYRTQAEITEYDLGEYLSALAVDLKSSLLPEHIDLTADVERGTKVSTVVATTVGMMVAELVMNSRKYGWSEGEAGRIVLTMRRDGRLVDIEVWDDGKGIPPGMILQEVAGVGLKLLQRQVQRLQGSFEPRNVAGGASFRLRFPAAP